MHHPTTLNSLPLPVEIFVRHGSAPGQLGEFMRLPDPVVGSEGELSHPTKSTPAASQISP